MEAKYVGAVLLYKAPIDKVAAKVLVERHQGSAIPVVGFWAAPKCSDEQRLEWEEQNILAIDLGGDKCHYTRNQVGSATEFMAKHIVGGELTPAEQKLIEMTNKNNRTGYLKGFYMSIAWTMRELYELHDDHINIMERVGHVVRTWLDFTDGVGLAADQTDAELEAIFPELVRETAKCNNAPFTPGNYLRCLWRLGYLADEIIFEKVTYWLDGWKAVKHKQAEAKAEFDRMMSGHIAPHQEFVVCGLNGILLRTDSKFLVRETTSAKKDKYRQMFDVVVVVNSDGRVSLISNNLDVSRLAEECMRREPGLWFHSVQDGLLLNGGLIYKDVAPSKLGDQLFLELLKKYPPRRVYTREVAIREHSAKKSSFSNTPFQKIRS